jgi:glycosyltransferase involved in cell wall biosynthesis
LSQPKVAQSPPSVSVVLSYFNSVRTIGKCIDALLSQNYPNYQIVVVDAGSTDGSTEVAKARKSPKLSFNVLKGCSESEGQRFAISSTKSDIIMFTNSDVYVQNDWITRHVAWLQRGYDLVGGKVFWGGDKFTLTWNQPKPKSPRFVQEQGLGLGFSNCSTTRRMFTVSGGLSEMKSQHDTEFAFRVVRCGGKMILDPEIEVYHDHPLGSFSASFRRSFGYAVNHVLVMRAVYGRIVSGSGAPAMVPISSVLKELTGLAGVKAYTESIAEASAVGIRTNLFEFMFIRLFSTKLGQLFGVVAGATKRKVAFRSVIDLHKRLQPSPLDVESAVKASKGGDLRLAV